MDCNSKSREERICSGCYDVMTERGNKEKNTEQKHTDGNKRGLSNSLYSAALLKHDWQLSSFSPHPLSLSLKNTSTSMQQQLCVCVLGYVHPPTNQLPLPSQATNRKGEKIITIPTAAGGQATTLFTSQKTYNASRTWVAQNNCGSVAKVIDVVWSKRFAIQTTTAAAPVTMRLTTLP